MTRCSVTNSLAPDHTEEMLPEPAWSRARALALMGQPFHELLWQAQTTHRATFDPGQIQISTLLNIKTGSCPEDCAYCSQSAHHNTGLAKEPLMSLEDVVQAASEAKARGSTRFCMGAAWRGPRDADLETVCSMVRAVKNLGMETCVTLGLLKPGQAEKLKEAGLDFYNHNIDTSPDFYDSIISTRTFQDRVDTLGRVQDAGLKTCCGGILGMGETMEDRVDMLLFLANMNPQPESVPVNQLIRIPGTPLAGQEAVDPLDFVRFVALARIMMPRSWIRLSAGRESMSDELQALCFLAGVNSVFYGEKLLTTPNPGPSRDDHLLGRLGLRKMLPDSVQDERGDPSQRQTIMAAS